MRIKLCEKYKEEREQICKKLIEIVNLDDKNSFLLYDLENDLEKQTRILDMKADIQKYFACSEISSFKQNFDCKRPYLNIVRGILRKQGYTFLSTDFDIKVNDVVKRTKKYIIFERTMQSQGLSMASPWKP
jgi:hypothetical protein